MQKVILCLAIVSSLFLASGCGRSGPHGKTPESVQQILKLRGYNFDEQGFFAAAQARDLQAINAFIDGGMNPNVQDADGRTVLISAAARGELDVVNTLLLRGVDTSKTRTTSLPSAMRSTQCTTKLRKRC
jgi:ankyrin repeat protein